MASIVANLHLPLLVNERQPLLRTLGKFTVSATGGRQGRVAIVTKATGESSESSTSLSIVKSVQNVWENSDRFALIGLGFASIVAIWASANLVTAIDKLPLIPSAFEFIGILFSTLEPGRQLHAHLCLTGLGYDTKLATKLVNLYSVCDSLSNAHHLLDRIPNTNLFLWNVLIRGYAWSGPCEVAISLYYKMIDYGIIPDNFTFPFVLKACSALSAIDVGKDIHEHAIRTGWWEMDVFVGAALIDMYAKCVGVLAILAKCSIKFKLEMLSSGTLCLRLIRKMGALRSAYHCVGTELHGFSWRHGFEIQDKLKTALDDMYAKSVHGHTYEALDLFKQMIQEELERVGGLMAEAGYVPNTAPVFHDVEDDEKTRMACSHSERLAIACGLISTNPRTKLLITKNLRGMAWFSGKVSLGNFPDLAGAVNKISESVKNIEKNFDSALGFEEKSDSGTSEGLWPSTTDRKTLIEPVMAFMGHKGGESTVESIEKPESLKPASSVEENEVAETDRSTNFVTEQSRPAEEGNKENPGKSEFDSQPIPVELSESNVERVEEPDSLNHLNQKETSAMGPLENSESVEAKPEINEADQVEEDGEEKIVENRSPIQSESQARIGVELPGSFSAASKETESHEGHITDNLPATIHPEEAAATLSESVPHDSDTIVGAVSESVPRENDNIVGAVELNQQAFDYKPEIKDQRVSSGSSSSDIADSVVELEKLRREMKMMETALQGAARQAQAKANDIEKLMNENEHLKAVIEDLRVYALTKERDTLRREQSKKSDAAALLKEKDEIINQVMAEGEELSKKQAAQESQIRKLRAQIRELEEEKKGLSTKLQVEENKVESIKRDKAATETLLQETIEMHQAELATQKEFYTNALNAAKEAEALAEARANNEARMELDSRLREAEERETMLVQALEELRQTLSRKEQQAVFREDMLRRDIEDLQKTISTFICIQASERRCEELVTQVPESTRPLLRQIEAMQETTARRAEALAAVERTLNSRLQEAEAKAAAAEERERSTESSRENRQEYLAAKEEADTHEGRVSQLEEEIRELRRKHKQELQEALTHQELLQQEIDREKAARLELERTARLPSSAVSDQNPITKNKSGFENGNLTRKLSSASSLTSMEESFFLQASLDSSDSFSERRNPGEMIMSPYFMKSMTPSAFESALRQKEGELASYMSRLASLESIRDSLAEELVKMTAQCEKLREEASVLPGIRAELDALRRRHSAALELMGERDEELEELRADIVDLKEMYREQVNLLVNKIQVMSPSLGSA
ncbi:golgin Putative 5 [Actinidia rufa]|uniref:Golgin Putative 5 n=1 Tax=Actinidia rufa TaxID=165716 RepID=A0A7J0FZP2_9ERIC|nr:golgin Putative 5 [Actinidia rufa]